MKHITEIAFAFPRGANQELFIEGILEYAVQHRRRWSYTIAPESNAVSISQLVGWKGDGVIAGLNSLSEARVAAKFHLPVVNISGALKSSPVPRSTIDNRRIGALAAEHFLERGYEHVAFYGISNIYYSEQRLEGLSGGLKEKGIEVASHFAAPTFTLKGSEWLGQKDALAKWIKTLQLPCAILATSDARARQIMDCCRDLQLHIPDQIALLGVDNSLIVCEHTRPMLSSIARDNVREGYEAARILDTLLQRKPIGQEDNLVPPLGLVTRQSTDAIAVKDEQLRGVLVYVRERIEEPFTVAQVCHAFGVSRRWLEYKFRDTFAIAPSHFIRNLRLEHAKRLLRDEPRTKIDEIAKRTGYVSSKQLAKAFRAEFGNTPRDYRKSLSNNVVRANGRETN